jgi:pyridoxamine 5'-phosphate oxidase
VGGNQSQVLHSPNDLEHALADARAKVEADPDAVPAQWTRYDVLADEVEFW